MNERYSELQKQIRESQELMALQYKSGNSNTTRSKAYKRGCRPLACKGLDQILRVDREAMRVHAQPRVTMEALARTTLRYGLLPPVIPEFKGITVGGAIMGAAAESTSHNRGLFHDTCTQLVLIDGAGNLILARPTENSSLFYGISGSYGSLGMLVEAEIELISVQPTVLLRYYPFQDAHEALEKMEALIGQSDFLDGILFAPDHGVIISGEMISESSFKTTFEWFADHAKGIKAYQEERMPLYDYLFRYDEGAFWMGSLLFSPSFLSSYCLQGLLKCSTPQSYFSDREIARYKNLPFPGRCLRALSRPLMSSQRLWGLLHRAEKWVQDRLIIQDCSIPTPAAHRFLAAILQDPGVYPIWLCPLKGTETPQHFAPHQGHPSFINFGLYGVPSYSAPMAHIMGALEAQTHACGGRKVLYSRSYYTEEDFWKIYPRREYEELRHQMHAHSIWRGLTDKVLSD